MSALQQALEQLSRALGGLEVAVDRRLASERSRAALETELALMQDDRARLAADLDAVLAQAKRMETANEDVDHRVAQVMQAIEGLLEQTTGKQG